MREEEIEIVAISDVIDGARGWWIECGNSLEVLRGCSSRWAQMCVTSPPYYNLRDYKIEPQLWGADESCDHEWMGFDKPGNTWGTPNKNVPGLIHKTAETNTSLVEPQKQAFCVKCGGWYGDLGSEVLHDCLGWATGVECGHCYICNMRAIFAEVWRILRDDGVCFINIGDSYAQSGGSGSGEYQKRHKQFGKVIEAGTAQEPRKAPPGLKPKDLCGIPWRLAFALQADGWYLRNDNIWFKNALPESVKDRCSVTHEYVFMLTKNEQYYFDQESIREPYNPSSIERQRYPTSKLGSQPGESKVKCGKGELGGGVNWKIPSTLSGANRKTVWRVTNESTNWDYCCTCNSLYLKEDRKRIKRYMKEDGHGNKIAVRVCPNCGDKDGWVGHFATFPTKLPEICIKAGSSHKACEVCGAPWERVLEPSEEYAKYLGKSWHSHENDEEQGMRQESPNKHSVRADYVTVGWQPTCSCENKGLTSSIVFDPFSGSARSGLTARRLGRRYVGIELNESYVDLSRKLMGSDMPLLDLLGQA